MAYFRYGRKTPRSTDSKDSGQGQRADSPAQLIHRNIELVAELEQAADAQRNPADRLADLISHFVGSMSFVYIRNRDADLSMLQTTSCS